MSELAFIDVTPVVPHKAVQLTEDNIDAVIQHLANSAWAGNGGRNGFRKWTDFRGALHIKYWDDSDYSSNIALGDWLIFPDGEAWFTEAERYFVDTFIEVK